MKNLIQKHLKRFGRDRRGNYAALTAIVIMPLFGAIALSVDISQSINVRSNLQNAADAAVLAAAAMPSSASDAQMKALVDSYFESNGGIARFERETTTRLTERNTYVEVSAQSIIKNNFAFLGTNPTSTVEVVARAGRTEETPEIALSVDTTGSMSFGTSWADTASAIGLLISEITGNAPANGIRLSLIPFNDRVNVGTRRGFGWLSPAAQLALANCPGNSFGQGNGNGVQCPGNAGQLRGWNQLQVDGQLWEGCTEPRERMIGGFAHALDDRSPVALADRFEPTVGRFATGKAAVDPGQCPPEVTIGTNRPQDITDAIARMGPVVGTGRPDMGLAWAWRALSPNWRNQWGVADFPLQADRSRKIAVLFTDGHTTIHEHELGRPGPGPLSWNNGHPVLWDHMADLCARMKDDDIEIMIFHVLGNDTATPWFRQCASDGYYFRVENRDGLLTAISQVGRSQSPPRLIR